MLMYGSAYGFHSFHVLLDNILLHGCEWVYDDHNDEECVSPPLYESALVHGDGDDGDFH